MDRLAYVAPEKGTLTITVVRDAQPRVMISLDLGIPNFSVFSMQIPLMEDSPQQMRGLLSECIYALLDELAAFMTSLEFNQEIIVQTYASILSCYKNLTREYEAPKGILADSSPMVEGHFPLPQNFVNETQTRVVTAKKLERIPPTRHLELHPEKPMKPSASDVGRIIRQYRHRSLNQPRAMYIIVYDSNGKPTGTVPVNKNFKNNVLRLTVKRATDFTSAVSFPNEQDLKSNPIKGSPQTISVGESTFLPVAYSGSDMTLYKGPDSWLVKFPDGRAQTFPGRPTIQGLRRMNFPVPKHRVRWVSIKNPEESSI
jgi:hypothetical protein